MKELRGDVALVLLANLVSKPLWLIADALVQNRIGHDSYGLIGALLGLGQWATAIADWGLYALVTREMARSPEAYPATGSTTLSLKVLLTLLAGTAFIGLGWLLGYRQKAFLWLVALISYQLALSYLQFFRAFFQGHQRFRIDALLSALEKGILLLLLMGSWSFLTGDLYVGLLLSAGTLSAGIAGGWVWRKYGLPRWQRSPQALWKAFRQMTPFALMGYATALNERLNQIVLERWMGAYENGLYWGAYRWFSAAMMYLWIVLPVFFARFALLGRQRSVELWQTFTWGHLLAALPLIGVAGVFIGEPQLLLLFFSQSTLSEIQTMSHILQVLAVPLTLNALFNIYSTYLTAVGYEWAAFWLMVGASLLNGIACVVFIPLLGGIGAALSLGVGYLFYSMGFVGLFRRYAPIPVPFGITTRLIGFAGMHGLTMFFMQKGLSLPQGITALISLPIFVFWAWVLGIFHLWRRASRPR